MYNPPLMWKKLSLEVQHGNRPFGPLSPYRPLITSSRQFNVIPLTHPPREICRDQLTYRYARLWDVGPEHIEESHAVTGIICKLYAESTWGEVASPVTFKSVPACKVAAKRPHFSMPQPVEASMLFVFFISLQTSVATFWELCTGIPRSICSSTFLCALPQAFITPYH